MTSIDPTTQTVSVRLRPASDGQAQGQITSYGNSSNSYSTTPTIQTPASWKTPCWVGGLQSTFSTGTLGAFLGFVPSVLRNRTLSAWRTWCMDGWRSAQSLAVVSGLYAWIQCLCIRIRLRDDGLNRGIAGCATGLAMGWSGGPVAALQSCAGLGLISYVVDLGTSSSQEVPAARAASLPCIASSSGSNSNSSSAPCCSSCAQHGPCSGASHQHSSGGSDQQQAARQHAVAPGCCGSSSWQNTARKFIKRPQKQLQRLPPVMFLGQITQPAYFTGL